MGESRVLAQFNRSIEHLCEWLVNDHPNMTFNERCDLALIIEDLVAQTRKRPASKAFIDRFGGRARRGRAAKATDDQLLLVRDIVKNLEGHGVLTTEAKKFMLDAHATRLGYKSGKELIQAITKAESRADK